MRPKEALSWYQRKIGAYDKQQWEQSVEQRILHGLPPHVPKKTARPKTEFIDVDLVRGSSFPKAKPKHGLWTVTRLGTLRFLFLPWYMSWWVKQTSQRLYMFVLLPLYVLELINAVIYTSVYFFSSQQQQDDSVFERIPPSEVLVPAVMMLLLSYVHSQIVATQSNNSGGNSSASITPTNVPPSAATITKRRRSSRRPSLRHRRRRSVSVSLAQSRRDESLGEAKIETVVQETEKEDIDANSDEAPNRSSGLTNSKSKCSELSEENVDSLAALSKEPEAIVEEKKPTASERLHRRMKEGTPLEDDGFESLNGNGSSEEGKDEEEGLRSEAKDEEAAAEADGEEEDEEDVGIKRRVYSNWRSHWVSQSMGGSCAYEGTGDSDAGEQTVNNSISQEQQPQCLLSRRNGNLKSLQVRISGGGSNSADFSGDQVGSSIGLKNKGGEMVKGYYNSSCESEVEELEEVVKQHLLSPKFSQHHQSQHHHQMEVGTEGSTSAEWIGVTTNSEECSYSSEEAEQSENGMVANALGDNLAPPLLAPILDLNDHPFAWEFELSSTVILSPSCTPPDKVSCTVWENREPKKADLSVLDISSAIIARVESMPDNMDYFYGGVAMGGLLAVLPSLYRIVVALDSNGMSQILVPNPDISIKNSSSPYLIPPVYHILGFIYTIGASVSNLIDVALGPSFFERCVVLASAISRFGVSALLVFLLAVAERTFKQRFLYAKLFSHLTSSRRARKSDIPHFRLNKVRNIKTWLSVRSYLKKRGPQRSVDVIVSAAFLMTLLLLTFLSVELLKDSVRLHSQYNLEALTWSMLLGVFLLRFMTLGTKINRKYRNLSVLITEQINLYLQIEQKPNKKEELMVANSVLKLAADLLKELESPFKISGLSANPYLYTITKVVILSALSGVLSEMLGFKLKLHKIKIK